MSGWPRWSNSRPKGLRKKSVGRVNGARVFTRCESRGGSRPAVEGGGEGEGGHIWDKARVQVTDYYRLTPVLVV